MGLWKNPKEDYRKFVQATGGTVIGEKEMLTATKHSSLSGIASRIKASEQFQNRFNNEFTKDQREKAFADHENIMNRLASYHGLDCQCRECFCILDRFFEDGVPCPECGSMDIASPYFC